MFFTLSKVLWFLTEPGNLLLLALCLGVLLLWTRRSRGAGRWLVTVAALGGLAAATLPLGAVMLVTLEDRFPVVGELPERVDGIVVLGGVVDQFVTRARGQVAVNGAVERLTELAALARRYPDARLVFSGGSGDLFRQHVKEADVIGPLLELLGLDPARVAVENASRNTHENALATRQLMDPRPGENWVLITSAFHMPRAVGSFRRAGWRIIPYPVDFSTTGEEGGELFFSLGGGLNSLGAGLHEWLGLAFYRLTGKTDALFPAPWTNSPRE